MSASSTFPFLGYAHMFYASWHHAPAPGMVCTVKALRSILLPSCLHCCNNYCRPPAYI